MEEKVLTVITSIRESFGSSIATYTCGNCYQFYEILKSIFPESEAYENGSNVFTKINGEFYDIKGKLDSKGMNLIPIDESRIKSLTKNKWTDERRKEYKKEYIEQLKNR